MNRCITVGVAVLVGVALGAAAIQTIHAQVAEVAVKDENAYMKEFVPAAEKSRQDWGGTFIVRGGKVMTLQGAGPAPRVVVIRFDNLDKAQAWWNSPAQKSAQAVGDKYSTLRSYAVEGVSQ